MSPQDIPIIQVRPPRAEDGLAALVVDGVEVGCIAMGGQEEEA